MKCFAILVILSLLVSCSMQVFAGGSPALTHSTGAARQKETDEVREAVFRYQFATSGVPKAAVYFLSLGVGKTGAADIFDASYDPSNEFMKRFVDLKVPVRKASASTFGSPSGRVVDKASGKLGVLFDVRSIKWISDTEVEVQGGFAAGMLYARGSIYTVKKEKGKWKVTKEDNTFMS
jgi:hypothetical protein